MKNCITGLIKKIFPFFKKRIDFSFLNAAGVLVFFAIFFVVPNLRSLPSVQLRNEKLSLDTVTAFRHDLSYIKPFTALVRFNRKAAKETETKTQEQKTSFFSFSLSSFKPF